MKKVPCEIYSRVVGYFRPIQNWNNGKREEFNHRVSFDIDKSMNSKLLEDTEKISVEARC